MSDVVQVGLSCPCCQGTTHIAVERMTIWRALRHPIEAYYCALGYYWGWVIGFCTTSLMHWFGCSETSVRLLLQLGFMHGQAQRTLPKPEQERADHAMKRMSEVDFVRAWAVTFLDPNSDDWSMVSRLLTWIEAAQRGPNPALVLGRVRWLVRAASRYLTLVPVQYEGLMMASARFQVEQGIAAVHAERERLAGAA